MGNLLKSFENLLILETRARDIYSAVLNERQESKEVIKKISFIKNQEIGHMEMARKLIEIAEIAGKRKSPEIISGKTLNYLHQDIISKEHLLSAIEQLINSKIQSVVFINSLAKRDLKFQKASKTGREFTRTLVHHLKNPLTITRWISELLLEKKNEKLTKRQREMVGKISAANKTMFSLVDDILEMGRLEEKKGRIKKEKVDLVKITKTIIGESANLSKIREQKINLQTPKKEMMLKSNAEILKMIISNLLTNAIRYGKRGGKISIKIKKEKPAKVLISVSDDGIGIPREEQKNIFQKFFRASNAKKLSSQGSGLGLYLTRELVRELGGKIWFKSEENKGSEFFLLF